MNCADKQKLTLAKYRPETCGHFQPPASFSTKYLFVALTVSLWLNLTLTFHIGYGPIMLLLVVIVVVVIVSSSSSSSRPDDILK